MKAEKSPLFLRAFDVNFSEMSAHLDDKGIDESKTVAELLDELPIEIDYHHYLDEIGFHIDMQVKVNRVKSPKFGYVIQVISRGMFEIDPAVEMSEQLKHNLSMFSAVNIMLSSIRGYLRDITSYGQLGTYLLPSIDIGKLVGDKKAKELRKAKKLSK